MARRTPKIEEATATSTPKRGWHREKIESKFGSHPYFHVKNGYHVERCPGEAHSNMYIDGCTSCLGHVWGFRAVKGVKLSQVDVQPEKDLSDAAKVLLAELDHVDGIAAASLTNEQLEDIAFKVFRAGLKAGKK